MLTEVVEKQRPLSAGAEVKLIVLLKNYNKTIRDPSHIFMSCRSTVYLYIRIYTLQVKCRYM